MPTADSVRVGVVLRLTETLHVWDCSCWALGRECERARAEGGGVVVGGEGEEVEFERGHGVWVWGHEYKRGSQARL